MSLINDLKNFEAVPSASNTYEAENYTPPAIIKKENKDIFILQYNEAVNNLNKLYKLTFERAKLLINKYLDFLTAKNSGLTRNISYEDTLKVQTAFEKYFPSKNFITTLYDGMKKGLIGEYIYDPAGIQNKSEILKAEQKPKDKSFIDQFAETFASVFSKPLLELFKQLLPILIVLALVVIWKETRK